MTLKQLNVPLSVCSLPMGSAVDLSRPFTFAARTDEELSLVCPTDAVPETTLRREDGWLGFRIEGVLDFSLIGVLSRLSAVLAENHIGLFAVSTYNTDYILVKEKNYAQALSALEQAGYEMI